VGVDDSSIGIAPEVRASQRVVVHVNSSAARWVGALALLSAACWLMKVIATGPTNRLEWSWTAFAAVAFIARGIFLGRPVTARHAVVAVVLLFAGFGAHLLFFDLLGDVLIAGAGLVLMWPTSARRPPGGLSRIWALIQATRGDPLAPFAMQTGKCYLFSANGTAALAYRTRLGYAVVSGDPVGDEAQFPQLVADFASMCHAHGWRIVVLACSERRVSLWTDRKVVGHKLRPVPIGRDVVVDVSSFEMVGRKFRNLRQAVNRTHNCGITTKIVDEQRLDGCLLSELTEVVQEASRGAQHDRGFCMNLDGVLEGRFPGMQLIVARDKSGRVQGFHRYATAGGGSDITLDVPWRRPGSPNGIDERLSVDMINAAKEAGAQRLSLAFAAFPEIFDEKQRGRMQTLFYWLIHLLDPFIALESLYRYLRKFHAPDQRRYALVRLTQLVPLIYVLLSLEFMPRRRNL
jgi:lysylphosphatidylglycerol synthetase-like protein (DUF2156 family)